MSKFCPKCGSELNDSANFCNKCGEKLTVNASEETAETNTTTTVNNSNTAVAGIPKRDIVVAVILSIITCGIYAIYWMVVMTDESNKVSGDFQTSGGMVIVYTLITCGIYSFYWNYKMGQKLYNAGQKHGKDIADNSVLYLILSIIGVGIVSSCLMQNDLNKFAE